MEAGFQTSLKQKSETQPLSHKEESNQMSLDPELVDDLIRGKFNISCWPGSH